MTVLPNDDPNRKSLGWVIQERSGFELHPIIDGKLGPDPVPMTDELVVGQDYAAIGITGQYIRWTVGKDEYGEYTISSGPNLIGVLQRGGDDGDDRKCWLVTGQINTRGLTKLSIQTEP
jgi:hypothetical protein